MTGEDIRRLVAQLTSASVIERAAARLTFLRMDESAVQLLANELYGGVNIQTGVVILELIGEIGGRDALLVLQDICFAENTRPLLAKAAARALVEQGYGDLFAP